MPEIELVRIPVKPDRAAGLIALIEAAQTSYLGPPACTAVDIAQDDGQVVAVMHWSSAEAHRVAAATPEAGAFFAAVKPFAAGVPTIETFEVPVQTGRLSGQVALVTGGANGIGRAVVDRFVAEGARVGVADLSEAALAQLRERHGDRVMTVCADLTTIEGNVRAVEETVDAFGKLDSLIANAGVFDGFFEFAGASLEQLDNGFDALFNVNVRGMILASRAALPHLVRSRGSITMTLSNASFYPDGGGVLYIASKHAALGVLRQLAHELAPVVRVNAVAPGATRTAIGVPAVLGGAMDQTGPEISAAIANSVPLAEHFEPVDHVAAYVLLTARGESRAMTGTVIESDGGLGIRGLRRIRGGDALVGSLAV